MSPPKVIGYCGVRVNTGGPRSCSLTESFWSVSATRQITLLSVEQWGGENAASSQKPGQGHLIIYKHARIENLDISPQHSSPGARQRHKLPQSLWPLWAWPGQ